MIVELLTITWGLGVAVVVAVRLRRSSALGRRHAWPMLIGGAGIALCAAAAAAHRLTLGMDVFDSWAEPVRLGQLGALGLLAAGAWFRLWLPRRSAEQVARAVLTATPSPAELAASLARAADDPGLIVTYRRLDGQRIDADGRPVDEPGDRTLLRLTRDGTTYAEVWHTARAHSDLDLLLAAVESSGSALEYVAAQARLLAETSAAVAARRRIVVSADAERSRLERDLHDGAQQGLITLSVELALLSASARSPTSTRALTRAQQQIGLALDDLRTVARGLFPVSLAEAGLDAGLRELGDHTSVPVVVDGHADPAGLAGANRAIFDLVREVAGAATVQPDAAVRVQLGDGTATTTLVRVTAPVKDERASMVRPSDRFAALGGRLTVTTAAGQLIAVGEIPCES